ncbi:MAG: metallophosphoesterase [Nanoarchaeota archaeon]|nr:metallophosphoesterase [Nanoarchaeota archaeon]
MNPKEILKYCIEKGVLIDSGALNLLKETGDSESTKLIIEKLRTHSQKKVITRTLFEQNKEEINKLFLELPNKNQKSLESLKIKLGLEIEISRVLSFDSSLHKGVGQVLIEHNFPEKESNVKIMPMNFSFKKKIEVSDFVKNFKNRFTELRNILQDRKELENLISINKLSKSQKSSIIGIVYAKRITKNKNLLLDVEDLTGTTRVLINQNNPELYKQAEEISLDSTLGFSGFGDREIFFANNLVFPDAAIFEKKNSPEEEYAIFMGDIHYGSKLFLAENFDKFINYLNGKFSNTPEVDKIKYLFLVGDIVSGVGIYPSQQKGLNIDDIEEQFEGIANLLKKIRKDIKIIISPGNHDGVRLLEPQPFIDEKYAWPLYNMENVIMTGNPARINIGAKENFSGFDILTYHGFSYPYYANNIPAFLEKGLNAPEKIMAYILKNRHLAPTYSSAQFVPFEEDQLVMKNVPDVFVSGHSHKCAVASYNNVLLISAATWESKTEFQEKMGNEPDFCKVPMLNLKTRAIKILDFE